MKNTHICDYLEFDNIWQRKKGYEAHRKRLQNAKEKNRIEEMVTHQILCNKKKEETKQKAIQINNDHIVRRMLNINNQKPKVNVIYFLDSYSEKYPMITLHGGQKSMKKMLDQKQIDEENYKIRQRLISVQPHFNHRDFLVDYNRHLNHKNRMERFSQDQNKVTLKAINHLNQYEQSIYNRSHKQSPSVKIKHLSPQDSLQQSNSFFTDLMVPHHQQFKRQKRLKKQINFFTEQCGQGNKQKEIKNEEQDKMPVFLNNKLRQNLNQYSLQSQLNNRRENYSFDQGINQNFTDNN